MFFDMHIPYGSYRTFDEIIQAHDRVYSDDPELVQLGCEQIFGWVSKSSKNQYFFEITALIANNLIQNSKSPLGEKSFKQFFNSMKYLTYKIISEFPSDYEYYQYLSQYAYCDDGYFPPKDELFTFSENLLVYLNENFWIPNIEIHQKRIEDSIKYISEYFESEGPFNISKTNFLFYFVPVLAKEFCKDTKEKKLDDKELVFGFSRSELLSMFPKFINNAIDFTDQTFIDSFALEFSDYFIQGSIWALKVLDMLLENKLVDANIIFNYISCAPNKNQKIIDFLKKHNVPIDEQADNFWYGTPMGFLPYQYDEYNIDKNPNLEVDSSLVGILHEERKNIQRNTQNNNKFSNNDSNSKKPTPVSTFSPTKIHNQPKNTQNNNPKPQSTSNSTKPNVNHHSKETKNDSNSNNPKPAPSTTTTKVTVTLPNRNSQNNSGDNKSSSSNKPKPVVISFEKSKDKKLDVSKPHEKK